MSRYVVVKGRNVIVGKQGCDFSIFDIIELSEFLSKKQLENQMRKYAFRKLYEVDNKKAKDLRNDTWCRRRHILRYDDSILIKSIKIIDHSDGTFYGFIPVKSFSEYKI